jgi:cell division septation protein DedD
VSPERNDEYQDEEERDEYASRSIFAAGWFRAVLVLTVLAIVVVISLPYLLNWFEPAAPPRRVARQAALLKPAPATPPPAVGPASAPAPPPTVAAPQESKPAPTLTPAPAPRAASAPPATSSPAPKAVAEKPAAPAPARKAESEKAPVKTSEKSAVKTPAEKASMKAAEKAADKPAAASRVVAKADPPSRSVVADAKPSPASAASGNYWIQLGAFKEEKNAEALAKALRGEGFPAQVTPIRRGTSGGVVTVQQHELFVSEAGVEKVNIALKGRGTGQSVAGGVAVRPAFSLQEAMTVSKRLTDEGFKVVIRPASGPPATSEGTLHAVRAGGYSNRSSAVAALDELSAKGHRGFLAEGSAK